MLSVPSSIARSRDPVNVGEDEGMIVCGSRWSSSLPNGRPRPDKVKSSRRGNKQTKLRICVQDRKRKYTRRLGSVRVCGTGRESPTLRDSLGLPASVVQREKRFESNRPPRGPSLCHEKPKCGYNTQDRSWKGPGRFSSMTRGPLQNGA